MRIPDRSMTTPDNRTNEHTQPPDVCDLEHFRTEYGFTEFDAAYQYDGPIITTVQHNRSFKHSYTANKTFECTTLLYPDMHIPAKLHLEQGVTDKDFAYHLDTLGSVRLLSDSSKDTAVSYTYLPYGESTLSSGTDSDAEENRYRFTAREFEQPHFTYYRSRYYANRMGRFLKKDTYRPSHGRPLTLNKYLYTEGNPINLMDLFGYYSHGVFTYGGGVTYHGGDDYLFDTEGESVIPVIQPNLPFIQSRFPWRVRVYGAVFEWYPPDPPIYLEGAKVQIWFNWKIWGESYYKKELTDNFGGYGFIWDLPWPSGRVPIGINKEVLVCAEHPITHEIMKTQIYFYYNFWFHPYHGWHSEVPFDFSEPIMK